MKNVSVARNLSSSIVAVDLYPSFAGIRLAPSTRTPTPTATRCAAARSTRPVAP
jgi:hypothetical protein